jgi:hypothetical protein
MTDPSSDFVHEMERCTYPIISSTVKSNNLWLIKNENYVNAQREYVSLNTIAWRGIGQETVPVKAYGVKNVFCSNTKTHPKSIIDILILMALYY